MKLVYILKVECVLPSQRKNSREFVDCRFSADATICRSRTRSTPTAVSFRNQKGTCHRFVHCQLWQYRQSEQPILVVGEMKISVFWALKNIPHTISKPTKNTSWCEVMWGDVWWVKWQSAITFEQRQTTGSPAYGQIGLAKANLFQLGLVGKEGFNGLKMKMFAK